MTWRLPSDSYKMNQCSLFVVCIFFLGCVSLSQKKTTAKTQTRNAHTVSSSWSKDWMTARLLSHPWKLMLLATVGETCAYKDKRTIYPVQWSRHTFPSPARSLHVLPGCGWGWWLILMAAGPEYAGKCLPCIVFRHSSPPGLARKACTMSSQALSTLRGWLYQVTAAQKGKPGSTLMLYCCPRSQSNKAEEIDCRPCPELGTCSPHCLGRGVWTSNGESIKNLCTR